MQIEGTMVRLRPLEWDDINERYLSWLNNPAVTHYMDTGKLPYTLGQLMRYYEGLGNDPSCVMLAIEDVETDLHIGNVKLQPIHWLNRTAVFGIMIGDTDCWGRGMGTEATELMLHHAFDDLNIRKVTLTVHADHQSALTVYRNLGFTEEGRQRQQVYRDGDYCDLVMMGLLREDMV